MQAICKVVPTMKGRGDDVGLLRCGFTDLTSIDSRVAAPMIDLTFVLCVLGPRWWRFGIEMELRLLRG